MVLLCTFEIPIKKAKLKLGTGSSILSPAIWEAKTRGLLEPKKMEGSLETGLNLKITRQPQKPTLPWTTVFSSLPSSTLATYAVFCIFLVFTQWDVVLIKTFHECNKIPDSKDYRRKESLSLKDFKPSWWESVAARKQIRRMPALAGSPGLPLLLCAGPGPARMNHLHSDSIQRRASLIHLALPWPKLK